MDRRAQCPRGTRGCRRTRARPDGGKLAETTGVPSVRTGRGRPIESRRPPTR